MINRLDLFFKHHQNLSGKDITHFAFGSKGKKIDCKTTPFFNNIAIALEIPP